MGSHKVWDLGSGGPKVELWDRDEDVGWMGSYGMWDLGSGGPKMELWVTGMDGVLRDVGFGVGWPQNGDMGHRDEWVPMGWGIWGRVALKWRYGAQG